MARAGALPSPTRPPTSRTQRGAARSASPAAPISSSSWAEFMELGHERLQQGCRECGVYVAVLFLSVGDRTLKVADEGLRRVH